MKILIVYAHLEPGSFNHALKEEAKHLLESEQHQVKISDLYQIKFNPTASWDDFKKINSNLPKQYGVLQGDAYLHQQFADDIKEEQNKLAWCDRVIFQFPLWWFGMPAILKGWFDRILAAGFSYEKEKWFATGLLNPRKALLSVTTQSPVTAYQTGGMHGDINQFLHPIHHTLRFVGITPLPSFVAYGVMNMNDEERRQTLAEYKHHLLSNFKD